MQACVHALECVLGWVVAGRFWCSYAWVSLTQTAPVRPRGCVLACAGVRAGVPVLVCACVRLCAFIEARAGACVPVGGVGVV